MCVVICFAIAFHLSVGAIAVVRKNSGSNIHGPWSTVTRNKSNLGFLDCFGDLAA